MNSIKIVPSILKGEIKVPPSKSLSHRALICAGLSNGKSTLEDVVFSKDIIATYEGLKTMQVKFKEMQMQGNDYKKITVRGSSILKIINDTIDCNESGSTLRFLLPIALLQDEKVTFTGKAKLIERPLNVYYEIFENQCIKYENNDGKLPLTVEGRLMPGEFKVNENVSSQFITGLLFALPLLDGDSRIEITTDIESKGYIDLTLQVLGEFGIEVTNNNYKEFFVKGNQKFNSTYYRVEGDFSQGAFWIVAGIIGGNIKCLNLNVNSLQGDIVILEIIRKMNGNIKVDGNDIIASKSETRGVEINVSECPDLVPILAVLGALSQGTTRITNAQRARIKESDRLKAISTELKVLGADIEELEDGLIIRGKQMLKGGEVNSWNDHRIAMALAVASIRCKEPVIIRDSISVEKSYPNFWEDYRSLGGETGEFNLGE